MIATCRTQPFGFFEFLNYGHQIHRMVSFVQFEDGFEDFLMTRIVEYIGRKEIDGIIEPFLVDQESADYQFLEFYCIRRHFTIRNREFFRKIAVNER